MFCPHETLLRFRRTGGTLTPNVLFLQYLRGGLVWMLAFCLVGPLFLSRSFAQSANAKAVEALDPEKEELWKTLNARAVQALQDGRAVDALVAWKAAHQIKPVYNVACDIGGVELNAGNSAEAAEYLSDCLRLLPEPKTKEDLARKALIESKLKQAKSQAGTIQLVVLENGASISVNGKPKGVSPISDVFVPSGLHGLVIEKKGFQREDLNIPVEKGETKTIVVELKPLPPKEPEEAKPKEKPLLPEKKSEQQAPMVQAPKPAAKPFQGQRSNTLIYTGIGISGAGLAVGSALLIAAQDWNTKRMDKIRDIRAADGFNCVQGTRTSTCAAKSDFAQKQIQLTNGAILSFSIAGAVGLSTLAYALIPWKGFDVALGPSGAMVRGIW